jgi:hypothetical protein
MHRCSKLLRIGAAIVTFVIGQFATAQAGPLAYVTAHDFSSLRGPDVFGQLDLSTGVFTQISDLSLSGNTIFGMGLGAGGQLYGAASRVGVGTSPGFLFSINPTTGVATELGSLPFDAAGAASNSSGTLYALNIMFPPTPTSSLYAVNPPSNNSKLIGTVPFSADGLVAIDSKGNLFASGNGDGSFYEVNTMNASSKLVGNTGDTGLFSGAFVGNTLYGISTNQTTGAESIVTIDTSNASETPGSAITNLAENYEITSMAAAAVPEPSSLVLGLLGGLGMLTTYRLVRKNP